MASLEETLKEFDFILDTQTDELVNQARRLSAKGGAASVVNIPPTPVYDDSAEIFHNYVDQDFRNRVKQQAADIWKPCQFAGELADPFNFQAAAKNHIAKLTKEAQQDTARINNFDVENKEKVLREEQLVAEINLPQDVSEFEESLDEVKIPLSKQSKDLNDITMVTDDTETLLQQCGDIKLHCISSDEWASNSARLKNDKKDEHDEDKWMFDNVEMLNESALIVYSNGNATEISFSSLSGGTIPDLKEPCSIFFTVRNKFSPIADQRVLVQNFRDKEQELFLTRAEQVVRFGTKVKASVQQIVKKINDINASAARVENIKKETDDLKSRTIASAQVRQKVLQEQLSPGAVQGAMRKRNAAREKLSSDLDREIATAEHQTLQTVLKLTGELKNLAQKAANKAYLEATCRGSEIDEVQTPQRNQELTLALGQASQVNNPLTTGELLAPLLTFANNVLKEASEQSTSAAIMSKTSVLTAKTFAENAAGDTLDQVAQGFRSDSERLSADILAHKDSIAAMGTPTPDQRKEIMAIRNDIKDRENRQVVAHASLSKTSKIRECARALLEVLETLPGLPEDDTDEVAYTASQNEVDSICPMIGHVVTSASTPKNSHSAPGSLMVVDKSQLELMKQIEAIKAILTPEQQEALKAATEPKKGGIFAKAKAKAAQQHQGGSASSSSSGPVVNFPPRDTPGTAAPTTAAEEPSNETNNEDPTTDAGPPA